MKVRRNKNCISIKAGVFAFWLGLAVQTGEAQVVRGTPINSLLQTNSPQSTNISADAQSLSNAPVFPAPVRSNTAPEYVVVGGEKYLSLPFAKLAAFGFRVTAEIAGENADPVTATARTLEQIPLEIKSLNEKGVAVTGFMLPVHTQDGLVTDFLLLRNQSGCCYGVMPRINEMVVVHTGGKGVKALKDVPVTVLGNFRAGALRDNGSLIGIYEINCNRVVDAQTLNKR